MVPETVHRMICCESQSYGMDLSLAVHMEVTYLGMLFLGSSLSLANPPNR